MARIICPICGASYARYVKRKILYGEIAWKVYDCENCGTLHHDHRTDKWYRLCDICNHYLVLWGAKTSGLPIFYECSECGKMYELMYINGTPTWTQLPIIDEVIE